MLQRSSESAVEKGLAQSCSFELLCCIRTTDSPRRSLRLKSRRPSSCQRAGISPRRSNPKKCRPPLHELTPEAPLKGFTQGGYRLVYRDTPNAWTALAGKKDFDYSIAMKVRSDGVITDVLIGGVADKAGFASGMKLLSVNGKPFWTDQLQQAIRNAKGAPALIECVVENNGVATTLTLAYHGGEQYPALERDVGTTDRLLQIATPR